MDGFLLDRGFQIFLTSYPEAQVRQPWLGLGQSCTRQPVGQQPTAATAPTALVSLPPARFPDCCLQAALDYESLDLHPFYAGALVRFEGDFHRVADPLR